MGKIYLASPHMSDEGYEKQFVKEAFETNWIAPLGENVNNFEKEVCAYVGIKNAAALTSGTAGIHLGLKALGMQKEDVVFCSSLTFSASCNPILYENATPVFIDSEPETWNMSPQALEKAFENYSPKAVIVVHLYGHAAKMDEIMEICNRHQVPVLEDAAESLGTTYQGKFTGTFGKYGVFSFNGNKIITTSGGGMVVSDDEKGIEKIRFWATQSRDQARYYQHSEIGYNYRMSNVLAGIGRGQLKVLETRIAQKNAIFRTYRKAFEDIPEIQMHEIKNEERTNNWLSVMTVKEGSKVKPMDIIEALEKEDIEARLVWKPMHLQPIFEKYDFFKHDEGRKSIAEDIFNRGVCLPSDTKNTKEDMDNIIQIIKNLF